MFPELKAAAAECVRSLTRLHATPAASPEAIEELCSLAPAARFVTGDVVFREGDPADRAYLILSGRLRATLDVGEPAGARTLGESGPGEVVGETAIFYDGGRRVATLTALEPTVGLTLTRPLFRASEHNPALVTIEVHLVRLMIDRIKSTDDLLLEAWRKDPGGPAAPPDLRDRLAWVLGGAFR